MTTTTDTTARPLEGLSDWLREQANMRSEGSPMWTRLREWAAEVDRARELAAASIGEPPAPNPPPKCSRCGNVSASNCNEVGCGYLESGIGEPPAPIQWPTMPPTAGDYHANGKWTVADSDIYGGMWRAMLAAAPAAAVKETP